MVYIREVDVARGPVSQGASFTCWRFAKPPFGTFCLTLLVAPLLSPSPCLLAPGLRVHSPLPTQPIEVTFFFLGQRSRGRCGGGGGVGWVGEKNIKINYLILLNSLNLRYRLLLLRRVIVKCIIKRIINEPPPAPFYATSPNPPLPPRPPKGFFFDIFMKIFKIISPF